jgi:hypothetical protein
MTGLDGSMRHKFVRGGIYRTTPESGLDADA